MIQNYSIWRVLQVFFDDPNPRDGFTVRWISKQIKLAPPSVRLHLKELSRQDKEGYPLVKKTKGRSYPLYWPNRESKLFLYYKKMDMQFRLEESGLLDYLYSIGPTAIILFGSATRGEDDIQSDIDLFLLSKEKKIDVTAYEKILKRNISLHFAESLDKLPKELRNNVINGIILRGYVQVF